MASKSGTTKAIKYGSTIPEEPTPVELILEHVVISTDQQLVCTMAMVCKDWQAATQRAAIGRLHVHLEFEHGWAPGADGLPSNSMRKLFSFAQWLPKHAQIVSKLKVSNNWDPFYGIESQRAQRECSIEWLRTVVEPTLGLALRGAAVATASHGATQLQAMGLRSYSSHGLLNTSVLLNAFPATSLTELEVLTWDIRALAPALPRLPNLQRLKAKSLRVVSDSRIMTATLQAACELSALTSLDVNGVFSSGLNQLPVQLLRLALQVEKQDKTVADLSHLTRLTSLDIDADPAVGGFTLPVQLVELCTRGSWRQRASISTLDNFSSLRQLKSFSIVGSIENAEELLQLGQLANLQNLALEYYDMDGVVAASLAWPQLRQLKGVTLRILCPAEACLDLVRKLSCATQLTRLDVDFMLMRSIVQEPPQIAICHEIAKLKTLQDLSFDCFDGRNGQLSCVQDDIYHLSKLTHLTKFNLCGQQYANGLSKGHEGFDDPTVVRLLLGMKNLEDFVCLSVVLRCCVSLQVWQI